MSSIRDQACISRNCQRARQAVPRYHLQENKVLTCPGLPRLHSRISGVPRMQWSVLPKVGLGCAVPAAQPVQPPQTPRPGVHPLQRLWVLWGTLALQPSGMDLRTAINLQWKTDALVQQSGTLQADCCPSLPCSRPGTGQPEEEGKSTDHS